MFPEKIEFLIDFIVPRSDCLYSRIFYLLFKISQVIQHSDFVCLFATSTASKSATNNLLYLKSTSSIQCYKIIQSDTKEEKKDGGISAKNVLSILQRVCSLRQKKNNVSTLYWQIDLQMNLLPLRMDGP